MKDGQKIQIISTHRRSNKELKHDDLNLFLRSNRKPKILGRDLNVKYRDCNSRVTILSRRKLQENAGREN